MNVFAGYLFDRLREYSTWRGVAALGATAGVLIAPEQLDAAYKAFVAVLGVIAVFTPVKKEAR